MNNAPATDSVNFIGNEVTNTGFLMGLYFLQGTGHFQYGNNIKGTITPTGTAALSDTSYFYPTLPNFWSPPLSYPPVGPSNTINTHLNPAKERYLSGSDFALCNDNILTPTKKILKSELPKCHSIVSVKATNRQVEIVIRSCKPDKIKIELISLLGQKYNSADINTTEGTYTYKIKLPFLQLAHAPIIVCLIASDSFDYIKIIPE